LDDLSEDDQKELFREIDKNWKAKDEVTAMLNDPFKLDEKADTSHMDKANWEDVQRQSSLNDKPAMMGSVRPIRGGEDYNANPFSQTARGQNSIDNPDAIKALAESEEEDTGARLRKENEQKEEAKKAEHERWQKDKIASMEDSDIIPKGNIFPTESMTAQPGLKEDVFNFDVPDKTEGEKIAEANEERRKAIQGEDKEQHEFELKTSPKAEISDTFADALKKALRK
jgi:hypothetical protein